MPVYLSLSSSVNLSVALCFRSSMCSAVSLSVSLSVYLFLSLSDNTGHQCNPCILAQHDENTCITLAMIKMHVPFYRFSKWGSLDSKLFGTSSRAGRIN